MRESGFPDVGQDRKSIVFGYLKGLLPDSREAEIAAALSKTHQGELREEIAQAGRRLGAQFYEVEASLSEMLSNPASFPALELSDQPRVLLKAERDAVVVLAGQAKRKVRVDEWGDQPRRFILAAPRRTLGCLRGKSRVQRVLSYLLTERSLLRALVIYAVFVEVLSLAAPLAVQVLINTIGFGMMTQQLIVLSFLLFVALAGAAALKILQQVLVEYLSRRFFARTVSDYSERLPVVAPGGMKNPIFRFFEVASVDKTFFILGLDLVALVLQLLAATLLLALYHPVLLGFTIVMVVSSWLVVQLPFSAGVSRSLKESHAKYALADYLSGGREDELERLRLYSDWEDGRRAVFRIAIGQQAGLFSIQVLLSVALLFLGGHLVILGQLTLGQLVAAELVAGTALMSLGKLGKQLPKIYDLITSFEKLGSFVDLPLVPSDEGVDPQGPLARGSEGMLS